MTEPTREQLDNLLDRAERRTLTRAETDRLRAGFDGLRQQLALSRAGASAREVLLTEARDALEADGSYGDAWPDIVAPIHKLIAERDRLRADLEAADAETEEARDHNGRTCEAVAQRDTAEAAVQRVRDLFAYWTREFPDNPAAEQVEEAVTSVIDGKHRAIPGGAPWAWGDAPA